MTSIRRFSPLPSCPKHPGFLEGACIRCRMVEDNRELAARKARGMAASSQFAQRAEKLKAKARAKAKASDG